MFNIIIILNTIIYILIFNNILQDRGNGNTSVSVSQSALIIRI